MANITMLNVVINYIKVAGIVISEMFIAWALVSKIIVPHLPSFTTDKAKRMLFLVGTGVLLVAGLGRLGWNIQTWGGYTPPEKLDNYIFWTFSLGGTFLLLLDFFIAQCKK